jgi:hypothetical protein
MAAILNFNFCRTIMDQEWTDIIDALNFNNLEIDAESATKPIVKSYLNILKLFVTKNTFAGRNFPRLQ